MMCLSCNIHSTNFVQLTLVAKLQYYFRLLIHHIKALILTGIAVVVANKEPTNITRKSKESHHLPLMQYQNLEGNTGMSTP